MKQKELIKSWINENHIVCDFINERIFKIGDEKYLLLLHKNNRIFDKKMSLILDEEDLILLDEYSPDYFVIYFGDKFYYFDQKDFLIEKDFNEFGDCVGENMYIKDFHELRYVGDCTENIEFPVLGIHGGYDLCNASGLYQDYCKKAKWLGIKTLGICEENTLAGTLIFQNQCQKHGINSIIGETITIQHNNNDQYQIKLYCKDNEGWCNLLMINSIINTSFKKSIEVERLIEYSKGLIFVLTPNFPLEDIYLKYKGKVEELYYQLDFVEWDNDLRETFWLENLKNYFKKYLEKIPPIALYDCYYIEKQDSDIQPVLWRIGKREGLKYRSKDRFFKSCGQYVEQSLNLFKEKDQLIILNAIDNVKRFEKIDFKISTGEKHLPKYELTLKQKEIYKDKEELFWDLIEKGLQEKVVSKGLDLDVYLERINEEVRVIELGQVKDYFLIVWDILNFCRENDIITGIGRGSAAGCLISYLLGIVQIDPIHYGLLFERFLNEGRVGKSLPDIDNDIQGSRRDEVKRYIESRYGVDYVAGIGTYGTFKIRAVIKDLIREMGGDSKEAAYVSAILNPEDNFLDLLKKSLDPFTNVRLYQFVKKHSFQINHLHQIFHQPKTQSVHAAGVIIVPKDNGIIQRQLPVKLIDDIVITEWEGEEIETAGFLKVDILGIKQLDKFDEILKLIKQNRGIEIDLNQIPLDEEGVYDFFQKGFNEDVFQFGGDGLKNYCKVLKPDNIEDLIATVALYRPGPIEIGAHEKYAKIKNKELLPIYGYGLEEITKSTYSQIVYQEQIMKIVQELGGFSLVEADDIRKAMGKKIPEVMVKYKERFINGAIKKGCEENEALKIWMDMEGFAGYAFNRSHAACYAITGYYCQWLKYKYPLEFWLVSLKYSKENEMPSRIAEIKNIAKGISMKGPDIEKSKTDYVGDLKTNVIYWSLSSIKYVGTSALKEIESLRDGRFIPSFEDFILMIQEEKEKKKLNLKKGERLFSPINRRIICYMIIAGAFDNICKIKRPAERASVLKNYHMILYPELKQDPLMKNTELWKRRMDDYFKLIQFDKDYIWILEQKKICGFGNLDFRELLRNLTYKDRGLFRENKQILSECEIGERVIVAGIVEQIIVRNSKNGDFAQVLIHDGFSELYLTIWNEVYSRYIKDLNESKGQILFIEGEIVFDKYKQLNTIHSKSYTNLNILK